MGRKAKPTALKELEGNPGKRALNQKEPKPKVAIPECPAQLKGDARVEWKRITKQLFPLGVISELDRAALTSYCIAWGTLLKAIKMIEKEHEVIISENGGAYQNPWVSIRNKAMEQILKHSSEFGMTPSSRARIKADAPTEEDEMTAMLLGRKK